MPNLPKPCKSKLINFHRQASSYQAIPLWIVTGKKDFEFKNLDA